MKKGFTTFLSALKANTPPREKRYSSLKFLSLFLILFLGIGQMWGAASSVIPSTPDYKDIFSVATDGTYTFTCSSSNITSAANAESSWIGWYSTQSSFKEYNKSDSKNCMGVQTSIPNLKYDKIYFYIQNCSSFEIQGWANGDNRTISYSYQATDVESPTDGVFTVANKNACGTSGEIELDASKKYIIVVWNGSGQEIGVTYMVFNSSAPATTYTVTYKAGLGTGDDVVDDNATIVADCPAGFTAPDGMAFAGWKDEADTDVAVGATVSANMTLTAQWVQTYTVTYDANGGGNTMTDSNSPYVAGAEVTLLANAFTPPTGKEFDAWEVTETESGNPVAVSENKFTMPAAAVTVKATWKDACALDPTVSATTLGTTSYTTQVVNCAGISVLGSAGCTISEYGYVYGTSTAPTISDNKKALEGDYTVAGTAFAETTLSGLASNTTYYVRAFATNSHGTAYGDEISFTTLAPLGNVLVVANSASQTSDAITALSDNGFIVTVSAPNNSRDYTGYDLVVLDESLSGNNGVAGKEEGDIKDVNIPLLNLKSFFYNSGRWGWGTGNNGTADNEIAKIPATYKNAQSHPIFAGLTITDGNIDLIDPAKTGNTLQTATGLAAGKEGYVLATVGGNAFIHELTPAQRGVTDAKYLMVAISNNAKDNLSADGELLIVNAAKYLIGSTTWVPQYYTVSFDPHGGDPIAPRTGNPGIMLPETEYGTQSFLGWFTEEAGGTKIGEAGDFYTPTADITLHAQWEAISTDARLASITFSSDAGTLSPAFDPEITNYTYTMPYGTAAVPTITSATSVSAKAQEPQIVSQASAWGETAVIRGVAESSDTKAYNITMLRAPKDGVSIIKVATTGGTNKTVTGLYAGEGDVNLSNSKKMDGGKYIGFTLDGTTLQAGDRINVHTTSASTSGGSHIIFYDNMTDKTELYDTEEIGGVGNNIFTINAAMVGNATAYVYRSDADAVHKWNGYIDYIEVTRPMNPVLTAITINGEAGTINESAKTVAVELQPGYDLAALTIVPTIVSNTAEADVVKTVESNGGAWVIGDNTYRLTDKDGDYTDYTITLSVGVLKHTVSFNTHGGSTIDDVEVEDGQKLAAAPADPTKEDYLFQGWAETEDGSIVDVMSFTISADKEFHAVWAPDGAIKLLDGATVNHTNFITGVTADETVAFMGNNVNYAKFSGTVSGVNGVKDLTRVIAYNATTNKTKIRIYAHNNSTNTRNILVKGLVEGASEVVDLATIALGNKEDKVSDWIEFDNAANRTIYIMVSSSASDVYFTQVKVIESGETPMKQAGEAGYSLNFKKGRFFGLANTDLAFEGLNTRLSGDYTALNSDYAKLKATSMSFTVASAMTLSVTANNSKTYYVTKDAAGTDNETAKSGVSEFDLTAGTWYITAGSSEVQFTNIAFTAPKCEQPTVVDMENIGLCEGDAFTALTVSASVTDGGTLHYQWYNATDEENPVAISGATDVKYTPAADGQYYVIVTNKLADHSDNSKASNMVTVEHFASAVITTAPANQCKEAGQNATLTVAATGKAPLTYQWYTCDENGDNAVLIGGAEAATYQVEVTAAMHQYYKVVVGSGCGEASAVALVEEWTELPQANVTGSRTWDWTVAAMDEVKTADGNVEYLMANVSSAVPNNENFRSDMLLITAQYANRSESQQFFQGTKIRFNTTVDGLVRVNFRGTGNSEEIRLTINGEEASTHMGGFEWSNYIEVPAGEVTILGTNTADPAKLTRIQKIEFLALGYTRDVNVGELATVCLPNACVARDVEVYELVGKEPQYGKIVFDEILSGELMAGKPYLLRVTNPKAKFYYTVDAPAAEPDNSGAMKGTFEDITLTNLTNIYYFAQKALWSCVDLTSLSVPANRAYVKMDEMPDITESNPAPGRRRITLGVNGQQVATGVDQVQGEEVPTKMIINGQLFILRGEKMYDAQGKLVK